MFIHPFTPGTNSLPPNSRDIKGIQSRWNGGKNIPFGDDGYSWYHPCIVILGMENTIALYTNITVFFPRIMDIHERVDNLRPSMPGIVKEWVQFPFPSEKTWSSFIHKVDVSTYQVLALLIWFFETTGSRPVSCRCLPLTEEKARPPSQWTAPARGGHVGPETNILKSLKYIFIYIYFHIYIYSLYIYTQSNYIDIQ